MARWLLVIGIVVVALAGAAGWFFQDQIRFTLLAASLKPPAPFEEMTPPPAPDYTSAAHWAALPDMVDGADFTVEGTSDGQASADVDVFFVYPTTYLDKTHWNAPLDDAKANEMVDQQVLRAQASVFNGTARVFAPRYRQATFFSFLEMEGSGSKALDLAYGDVLAAFDHYIETFNDGRPFILAGHSQGSAHIKRLLDERISGTPLSMKLVAAYPIGYYIDVGEMVEATPDVPVCADARATGCFVTWNAVGPRFEPWQPTRGSACVNPLTWTTDGKLGTHEMNAGGLRLSAGGALLPGVADAQCLDGTLLVTDIRDKGLRKMPIAMGEDNFHPLDYSLFYMNLRSNVADRVLAYFARANTADTSSLN